MTDAPARGVSHEGLCGACQYSRVIKSVKGPMYILCERAFVDQHYPKYPTVPVLQCTGFQQLGSQENLKARR